MNFDKNNMPDVMRSEKYILSDQQKRDIFELKLRYNALHEILNTLSKIHPIDETKRLFAMAKSDLEKSCMAAVKAISTPR